MKLKLLPAIAFSAITLALTACGGGGGGGSSSSSGNSTDYAPDSIPAGTTMSINPTISFIDGATVNYSNTAADSAFSASLANVRYTYTPRTAGPTTATLAIAGNGDSAAKIFSGYNVTTQIALNFLFTNHQVTGATATINGQTYNVIFGGTALSAGTASSSATSGGAPTPSQNSPTINTAINGTYALNYHSLTPGGPYKDGDQVTFVLANDTLSFSGKTLTNPTANGGTGYFTDTTESLSYQITGQTVSFSVLQNGQPLGVFTNQTYTAPATSPSYGPLLGKVHHIICTYNDNTSPGISDYVSRAGTMTVTNEGDMTATIQAGSTTGTTGMAPNADKSVWTTSGEAIVIGAPSDQTTVFTITVYVDTVKHQITGWSTTYDYLKNGVKYKTATTTYKTVYTETP